jgi:hypothetical protein
VSVCNNKSAYVKDLMLVISIGHRHEELNGIISEVG